MITRAQREKLQRHFGAGTVRIVRTPDGGDEVWTAQGVVRGSGGALDWTRRGSLVDALQAIGPVNEEPWRVRCVATGARLVAPYKRRSQAELYARELNAALGADAFEAVDTSDSGEI